MDTVDSQSAASIPLPTSPQLDYADTPYVLAQVDASTAQPVEQSHASPVGGDSMVDVDLNADEQQDFRHAEEPREQVHVTATPEEQVSTSQPAVDHIAEITQEDTLAEQSIQPCSGRQTPPSRSSSAASHRRSLTVSRGKTIQGSEAVCPLKESVQRALELVKSGQGGDRPREIFEPLRLACETRNEKLMVASWTNTDSQPFPSPPPSPAANGRNSISTGSNVNLPAISLVDIVVHTITSCHSETTPDPVSLQIVKALLSLVLSSTILVHQSSLLKAVRTVYNVFLLSSDPVNQTVAQGGLTQMVNHVFSRVKLEPSLSRSESTTTLNSKTEATRMRPSSTWSSRNSMQGLQSPPPSIRPSLAGTDYTGSTLVNSDSQQPGEHSQEGSGNGSMSEDAPDDKPNGHVNGDTQEHPYAPEPSEIAPSEAGPDDDDDSSRRLSINDLFIKDAFLVFRALCKLTMKPLNSESERDLKSHGMRSKLLSLHLVLTILNTHMSLFVSPSAIIYSSSSREATPFVQAVNQYLCLCLSRNAVSPVPQVFEISVEIFWRVISGLRTKLKKEIEVLLHEIFIPILEMKTATLRQKAVILNMVHRLCQDPQVLVEIYLNYDCDSEAADNIYEHLMNIISKIGTAPVSHIQQKGNDPVSPAPGSTHKTPSQSAVPPSLSTTALAGPGGTDASSMGLSEQYLKRLGLECLVAVLKSLVVWGTAVPDEMRRDSETPDSSSLDLRPGPPSADPTRQPTPEAADDPSKFESAKQKKTTLLEGIKIQFFLESGFIPSNAPKDIAKFLHETDGLSKTMIGEYLGEGDEANITIMHAFVDMMEFPFRLPGEAQKIDRFMLKFAERYIAGNSSTPFANADAAYILAYSNNRGINDDADLPEEFLSTIYDDIVSNEIRMKDEMEATPIVATPGPGLAGALATSAYMMQSNNMTSKTEVITGLFKTLMRSQRKGSKSSEQFFSASHFIHVRPMFEVAWIPFLAVVEICLDGFKNAIRIVSFFDMELERNAFVTRLRSEMKTKNMEAIKTLLDVAVNEGNNLKGSWREVLTCVSQLEHMQLISSGVELPDNGRKSRSRKPPTEELANESRSTHITVAADMVFSLSHYLSGTAIVDFVRALCDVSWEEIQSSGLSQHPRLFSLQKLVEIAYYNMSRIRLEWNNLWDILGEHFNQVCCHNNPHVGFFALDALRQLAMRFLEKEELPHFKFQKDFLRPFEHTMSHNSNPDIRDMVLQCLQQMIQARVENMRSGWRTMFGVFSAASKVPTERIVNSAFELVTRYQKISLLAIAMLRGIIPIMLNSPECGLTVGVNDTDRSTDDPMIKFWFPVLFGFYDVIMNGEDLEVRRLALDSLFSTLKMYGKTFPELLFPIFAEDMSVWLSTTMIQALRNLIDLYTFYFETLERFLDGLLDLLCVCICQENDTLARIGTSCLQQLLENNRVATTFLFDDNLRIELDGSTPDLSDPNESNGQAILPAPLSPNNSGQLKSDIIVKCVLQLLLIEMTNDLLRNDEHLLRLMGVLDHSYQFARMFNEDKDLRTGLWKVGFMKHLPNLLKQESSSASTLVHVLLRMYYDSRPEHQAARPQVMDDLCRKPHKCISPALGLGVLGDYNKLRVDTQLKNIMAWTPVVAEIMQGFVRLDDKAFGRYMPAIYPLATDLLSRDLAAEVRDGLREYFQRVGYIQGIMERS
ncbi:guanine nucleotide exchange factor in Golgi transport N-terminal-domain-containing protein [Fomitopsis serialis]|uniref:guanine nucleotide exchange factor in Golgi transport N-terminal-domain-containing protein n=1 Tax=Fomitopsis serialis TaxID=139415 RepID=UPI0020072386|nr:guanine nucleotide exchange factor in Golgi transport N-terminal-domain-containing protein [Neoantrodia serialis]KAH9938300.1 guanine nucleotide exchange factor in Golgi transport N-terminal-domain-containing protein [Neoantrodia serialis]